MGKQEKLSPETKQIIQVVSTFCELMKSVEDTHREYRQLVNLKPFKNNLNLLIDNVLITGFEIVFAKRTVVVVRVWNNTGGWENLLVFEVSEHFQDDENVYLIDPAKKEGEYVIPWQHRCVTVIPKVYREKH